MAFIDGVGHVDRCDVVVIITADVREVVVVIEVPTRWRWCGCGVGVGCSASARA